MEVLKHGKNYYKVTCPYCKCKMTANRYDYKVTYNEEKDKGIISLECPECWQTLFFEMNKKNYKFKLRKGQEK